MLEGSNRHCRYECPLLEGDLPPVTLAEAAPARRAGRGGCAGQPVRCEIQGSGSSAGELLNCLSLGTRSNRQRLWNFNCDFTFRSLGQGTEQLLPSLSNMAWVINALPKVKWNYWWRSHFVQPHVAQAYTYSWSLLAARASPPQPRKPSAEQRPGHAGHYPSTTAARASSEPAACGTRQTGPAFSSRLPTEQPARAQRPEQAQKPRGSPPCPSLYLWHRALLHIAESSCPRVVAFNVLDLTVGVLGTKMSL